MEHQELVDKEFLKRLESRYSAAYILAELNTKMPTKLSLQRLRALLLSRNPPINPPMVVKKEEIAELRSALAELKAELAGLLSTQQAQSVTTVIQPDDCNHWTQLLQTHVQVIRVLELDEAKLGSEFHYSKRIELDERRKRADELRQHITANCP
jgi:hypothetical protein